MNYKLLFILSTFHISICCSKLLAQEAVFSKDVYIQLNDILGQQKNLWYVDFKYWLYDGNIDPALDESLKNLAIEPFKIISDTSWSDKGKRINVVKLEVQRYYLITFVNKKKETELVLPKNGIGQVELVYIGDSVVVKENNPFGTHTYLAIRKKHLKSHNMNEYSSYVLSDWSIRKNKEGVIDSTLYSENRIVAYKEYYQSGQIKTLEQVIDGRVVINNYNKKGKPVTSKKPARIDVDTVLVESYDQDLSLKKNFFYKSDTSVVNNYTWKWIKDDQKIVDSIYIENGEYIRAQNILKYPSNNILTDKIIYKNDTVYHDIIRDEYKLICQYYVTKKSNDKYFYYPDEFRYFKKFGWFVKTHDQGLDSTFYKNDRLIITKRYDENGELIENSTKKINDTVLEIVLLTITGLLAQYY